MALHLKIENESSLPDGGPISITVTGRRGLDIGRDQYLDWVLPDPTRFISGKHCEVRYRDGHYWLTDVSTNGTFLNGSEFRVDGTHALKSGDRIEIGRYVIAVMVEPEAGETAQEAMSGAGTAGTGALWDIQQPSAPAINPQALRQPSISAGLGSLDPLDWMTDLPSAYPPAVPAAYTPPPAPVAAPAPVFPPSAGPMGAADSPDAAFEPARAQPVSSGPPPAAFTEWAQSETIGTPQPSPGVQAAPERAPPQPFQRDDATAALAGHQQPGNAAPPHNAANLAQPMPQAIPEPAMPQAAAFPAMMPQLAEARMMPGPEAGPGAVSAAAPARTVPAPLAEARAPASGAGAFRAAFARGAGVDASIIADQDEQALAEVLGAFVRLTADNLRQLHMARAQSKGAMRSSNMTMIQAIDNNPLRFSPTTEDALRILFGPPTTSYLSPQKALESSFHDLKKHQVAVFAAMQTALRSLIDDLDPGKIDAAVEQDKGVSSLLRSRQARLWERYETAWKARAGKSDHGMLDVFMRLFSEAYDKNP
jgi:type VI secretion system protein ImpI